MVGGREREGNTGMRKKAVHLRRAGGDCSGVSRQLQGLEYPGSFQFLGQLTSFFCLLLELHSQEQGTV